MQNTTRVLLAAISLSPLLAAQRMICVDSGRAVSEVDITSGALAGIGTLSTNVGIAAGFAYDSVAGKLYVTSTGNDSVYLVDMSNWEARLIGNYGVGSQVIMHGIEWDWSTNTLYAAGNAGDFYSVDTSTGQATLIGATGLASFQNLGYDPLFDVMYMSNSGSDSLYTVDRATGAVTLVGPLNGPTNPNSLAYNIDNQTMYLADNSTDNLYTLDLATGQATTVGSMGTGNVLGMAYIQGTGRLSRSGTACGPTTMFVTGVPNIGGTVNFEVENVTSFAFVGFGLTALGIPFCGCTVGHEWSVAVGGTSVSFAIPPTASVVGIDVFVQGLDFLGTGGCPAPQLALTDTVKIAIGS